MTLHRDSALASSASRRALLTGAAGALAGVAAATLARPGAVRAEGQAIVVGGDYTDATTATSITNNANNNHVLLAHSAGSGVGVFGSSWFGYGVYGSSNQNTGVYGISLDGVGVFGFSSTNVGVFAQGSSGIALQKLGRAKFSTSGVATITAGHTRKTVTPGVNVTSGSFVLLTARANIGTRALWFTTDAANNKFTIRMSSSRSSGTAVAWLLLG